MVANNILRRILVVVEWVTLPVALITMNGLAVVDGLTFGVVVLPVISLMWMAFLGPILFGAYVCGRMPALRNIIGVIGIPWVALGYAFPACMPSFGEHESKTAKLLTAEVWPYSWEFWQLQLGKPSCTESVMNELLEILDRAAGSNALWKRTIERIIKHESLDT